MQDAYRTGDEIELLAESFAALSQKTVDYVEEVRRVTAEKEDGSVTAVSITGGVRIGDEKSTGIS